MNVLVTGASGFIGSNLMVFPRFEKTIGLDIKSLLSRPRVNCFQHDIKKPLEKLPKKWKVEGVVHLAALAGMLPCDRDPHLAKETNVVGTKHILDFCRRFDVEHFVFASTCGVYCEKKNPSVYVKTKVLGEMLCREYAKEYGIKTQVLRLANVYGPGFPYKKGLTVVHKFILQGLLNKPLSIELPGNQTRDFIHVYDVCRAIYVALQQTEPGTYFVGTGTETSVNELAELIGDLMLKLYRREIRREYIALPEWRKTAGARKVEIPKEHKLPGWRIRYPLTKGLLSMLTQIGYIPTK